MENKHINRKQIEDHRKTMILKYTFGPYQ